MADKQSREGKTVYVTEGLDEEIVVEFDNKPEIDTDSPFHWTVQRDAKKLLDAYTGVGGNEVRIRDGNSSGELTVKVNVDVSEALVGLKSLQREAREATKVLRELEAAQSETQGDGEITLSDATLLRLRDAIHAKSFPVDVEMDGKKVNVIPKPTITDAANAMISLGDKVATKSITDDITRSYGLGGDCE
ncbi:hypothetical protein [Bacillus sp. FSL K6-3431]|uniref:hypothetical protein n=1 Tax=Bacillus sp. FSL K6-3431 TaxID=2921500 RepID=UPI0030F9DBAD